MTRTLSGSVDIRGLTTEEARKEALRTELRSKLPAGWRIKPGPTFSHTPGNGRILYTVEIEPMGVRSKQ